MANRITTLFDFNDNGGLKKIQKDIAATEGTFKKMGVAIKGAFNEFKSSNVQQGAAIAGVAFGAKKAIDAASDLNESVNAVNVTFGDSAKAVLAIGDNSAKSLGLSKSEFNSLAVSASSFVKTIAAGSGRSVPDVLQEYTTRIADFASVMNLDLNTATQVFMSTLAGETEPIRRFGKDVSAAKVEAYALSKGLAATKAEITESIKVQARYGLLMEQTADTQGDFANTSDGLANSQRILSADFKDLQASIGKDLMPALQGLIQGMQSLIEVSEQLHLDEVFGFADDFDALGTKIGHFFGDLAYGGDEGRKANEALSQSWKDSSKAASEFDKTQLNGLRTFAEVHDKVTQVTGDVTAAGIVALKWKTSQDALTDSLKASFDAADEYSSGVVSAGIAEELHRQHVEEVRKELFRKGEITADVVDRTEELAEADAKAAEQAAKHQAALEGLRAAMDAQRDAALELVGGDIAVRDAQRDAATAASDLNDVLDNQETTLGEAGAAIDDAAEAQLNAAQAAADYRAQQMEANGQSVDAQTKAQLLKEELQNLVGQLDGPLAAAIQNYINQLNAIPKNIATRITVNKDGDTIGVKGAHARGGTVASGPGPVLVGEEGPELVDLPAGSRVHTASETAAMAGSVGASGGGVTYNFTLNVAQALTPAEVIDLAKKYERFNGAGWRGG